ncbi:MAG TPA: CBS domain-containing protein [bacterium]|nr:CBS domain-containing protein [bacterium]
MSIYQNLMEDRVSGLEQNEPLSVSPSTPVRDVIALLVEKGRGCVLVCEGEVLKGIFTERDFLMKIVRNPQDLDRPVRDFMTPDPVTVQPNEIVAVAIKKMRNGGLRHIPVVDAEGTPSGILSIKHIVHYLADHFPEAVYNLPPEPDQTATQPEGA